MSSGAGLCKNDAWWLIYLLGPKLLLVMDCVKLGEKIAFTCLLWVNKPQINYQISRNLWKVIFLAQVLRMSLLLARRRLRMRTLSFALSAPPSCLGSGDDDSGDSLKIYRLLYRKKRNKTSLDLCQHVVQILVQMEVSDIALPRPPWLFEVFLENLTQYGIMYRAYHLKNKPVSGS